MVKIKLLLEVIPFSLLQNVAPSLITRFHLPLASFSAVPLFYISLLLSRVQLPVLATSLPSSFSRTTSQAEISSRISASTKVILLYLIRKPKGISTYRSSSTVNQGPPLLRFRDLSCYCLYCYCLYSESLANQVINQCQVQPKGPLLLGSHP
jgi:hypothetical protein